MDFIESLPEEEVDESDDEEVGFKWDTYHKETVENYEDDDDFDDDDDDDFDGDDDFEVIYQK